MNNSLQYQPQTAVEDQWIWEFLNSRKTVRCYDISHWGRWMHKLSFTLIV